MLGEAPSQESYVTACARLLKEIQSKAWIVGMNVYIVQRKRFSASAAGGMHRM